MRVRSTVWLAMVFVWAIAATGFAQQPGEVYGKVTDASGAVMPGVTVTLAGPSLLQPMVATSGPSGAYRFPGLAVGTYTVTFEIAGFKTHVRTGLRMEIGANIAVNAALEISSVQETVTVSGATPLVDLRDTGKSNRFTQEALQAIPSARDPWVIIEQSAGVAMDRSNVGGSASGQQSNFVARGALMSQQKWNLDGVDVTDMNATGGSPVYFDFDAFEEMQISTGGNDVTMQSPGVAVNLVTKSGTDRLRGSGRYYITDEKFESVNLNDAIRRQGATSGNPIQRITDYGVEAGGPIKKGRAWFWGSYGKQDIKVGVNGFYKATDACQALRSDLRTDALSRSVSDIWGCLNTDLTTLNNYNAKVAVEPFKNNQVSFYFNAAEKVRNARNASDTHPIETTWRQGGVADTSLGSKWWKTGMPKTYKWSDRMVLSDRFMVELQYAHVGNNFVLDFHDPSLATVQPLYDVNTLMWARSYYAQSLVRPTDSVDATANYFLPAFLGGDHSLKAGLKYRDDGALTLTHYGGNAYAVTINGVPSETWIFRDGRSDYLLRNRSLYFQDSYARKRLTLTAGFRYDYQADEVKAAKIDAVPFFGQVTRYGQVFNQLPGVDFAGAKAGVPWKNFSPRVGASYDLTGNGRNVVKFNYSRYANQMGSGGLAYVYNPVVSTELDYPWTDLNGDRFVQANEIDLRSRPLFSTSGYDYNNPGGLAATTGTIDPKLTAPRTNEFIVSFDKQVSGDVAVSASYIYRRYDNFVTIKRAGMQPSDWSARTYTPAANPSYPADARVVPVTYYTPSSYPVNTVLGNRPDYYRLYKGIDLTLRKRMSKSWMATGSFSFNTAPQYYPTPASYGSVHANPNVYLDPTNITALSGSQFAEESTSSGLDNVFVNARWIFRVSGAYTVPVVGVGVAGFFNARSGYPYLAGVNVPSSLRGGTGAVIVLLDNVGDNRLPTVKQLDVRLDRPFTVFGRVKVVAGVDMFNLMNTNATLARRRIQNATNANTIANIVAPRVLRFGMRVTF
jgi:hypothetical protein